MNVGEILSNTKKYKDVQSLDLLGFSIYEKQEPIYNSKFLGVPLKYIAMGIISYHLVRKI